MSPGKAQYVNKFRQIAALLYKELLLRKCHPVATLFEIIFPIVIISIPCILYHGLPESKDERKGFEWVNSTTYQPIDPNDLYSGINMENLEFVYAPSNDATDRLMTDSLKEFLWKEPRSYSGKVPKKLNSEEELKNYILQQEKMNEDKVLIGTFFKNFGTTLPKDLDYKIYYTRDFNTRRKYIMDGPRLYTEYRYSFFVRWQSAIGGIFLRKKASDLGKDIGFKISLQMFPYPRHKSVSIGLYTRYDHELYIHLALICFVIAIVKRTIEDKNDGSKELMEAMGMTKSAYWTSAFTNRFMAGFIISLIIAIFYKAATKNTILYLETDFMLLFIILLLYVANLILFCMTFSIFFNRVAYGVIAVLIVYLTTYPLLMWDIYSGLDLESYFAYSVFHKLCICLYPPGVMLTSFIIIHLFEYGYEGVQWRNLTEYPMVPDINMLMVIAMMIFSCFLYVFAIWYFDTVWPWQPGFRKPFYFLFTKNYWFGDEKTAVPDEIELVKSENFEEEPSGSVRSVVIRDLSKVIQRGSSLKTVVSNVTLKCCQGQITALVGHSEAGKTSILNILAGKQLPTKGFVTISELDILTGQAHKFLGVCPQHNVLYDELTVEQHLKIYAGIKGIAFGKLTNEDEQFLDILKLSIKKAETVSDLSFSDRRKLSLAIAIVGASKVLLLDEPTYGMDIEAKRHVWDTLQSVKQNRTIIVATQSFQEADVVGDRIAVMASGEIHCCGTPAFIKQKLGAGYRVHVLKDVNFDFQGLKSIFTKHVPTAIRENDSNREVSFNIGAANDFGRMFEDIDSRKADLGVISYGVSFSTIKDVSSNVSNLSFTKQSFQHDSGTEDAMEEIKDVDRTCFRQPPPPSFANQFRALLSKHFSYSKRRWKFHLMQLAVPFFLMLMCFYCIYITTKPQNQPLELDISSVYGSTDGFYHSNDPSLSNLAKMYQSVLESNDVSTEEASDPTHYVLNYADRSMARYLKRLVVGGTFARFRYGRWNLTAWHNAGSLHSMPMSLLLMQTALLRNITNTGSISLTIAPVIPLRDSLVASQMNSASYFTWAIYFVPMAFTFVSLTFILTPAHERATKTKLLQLMSGVPAAMYWAAIFIVDFLVYSFICIALILPPAFFFPSIFFGPHSEAIGTLLVLFLLYGWASLPLGYIVSVLLRWENRGLVVFTGVCVLFGSVINVLFQSMIPILFFSKTQKHYGVLDSYWLFRFFPTYSIATGVSKNIQIAFNNAACDIFTSTDLALCASASLKFESPTLFRCCEDVCTARDCHRTMKHLSLTNNDLVIGNGPEALYLGLEGIAFFAILLLLETRTGNACRNVIGYHLRAMGTLLAQIVLRKPMLHGIIRNADRTEDEQVLQEEERVRNSTANQQESSGSGLAVLGLTKYLGNIPVANRLTFAVNAGELFGILGLGGVGKTSTFRILTDDEFASEGNALIQNCSLRGDFRKFQSYIGYCPAIDSTMEDLTGREMLLLFGQLKGLQGFELQNKVKEMIERIGLANCANELTQFYSGGDKRKLSVAVALIGSPPVILLDEPTLGTSPESRTQIWKTLIRAQKETGAAVLLATQNSEEGKAICNRLAIIVNGSFRCLGSIEQLTSKYGQGYVITIKIGKEHQNNAEKVNALKKYLQDNLKNASVTDDYQGMLKYQVVDPSMTIGHLFKYMLDAKEQFDLEDYSIGTISLEQILLAFPSS